MPRSSSALFLFPFLSFLSFYPCSIFIFLFQYIDSHPLFFLLPLRPFTLLNFPRFFVWFLREFKYIVRCVRRTLLSPNELIKIFQVLLTITTTSSTTIVTTNSNSSNYHHHRFPQERFLLLGNLFNRVILRSKIWRSFTSRSFFE